VNETEHPDMTQRKEHPMRALTDLELSAVSGGNNGKHNGHKKRNRGGSFNDNEVAVVVADQDTGDATATSGSITLNNKGGNYKGATIYTGDATATSGSNTAIASVD
jgi:hypothetical protein